MPELLIELFSEEIPARLQFQASEHFRDRLFKGLSDAGLEPEHVETFSGPRRLTAVAKGIPSYQADTNEFRKGPRVDAPAQAISGFLKSVGLRSVSECQTQRDKKGEYYVVSSSTKGRSAIDVVGHLTAQIIENFSWPKAMRWGSSDFRWVRPLHRVLCVFDGQAVSVPIDKIESGNRTLGHRFMNPEEFAVANFTDYEANLRDSYVVLRPGDRQKRIKEASERLCQEAGFRLVEDNALLSEVSGLVEWPVVLIGSFDERFLTLPDEVLIASMRGHQKYFSVTDPKTMRLVNRFMCVANIEPVDGGTAMRIGYERVLAARLSDAWHLYAQDLQHSLETLAAELDGVTFIEGFGTIAEKVQRIELLAQRIAEMIGADVKSVSRAARLCKADLVSQMVFEFPELQGVMGRYYASEQGESDVVANAIRDHYYPFGIDGRLPESLEGIAVSLADKIDSLSAFWYAGKKPTSSKDPFALRRAALGVIRMIDALREAHGADRFGGIDLVGLVTVAQGQLERFGDRAKDGDAKSLYDFIIDRLKVYLKDRGYRHDHIGVVISERQRDAESDLSVLFDKVNALRAFLEKEEGNNLVAAYKRAANILRVEMKKEENADFGDVQVALFESDAELGLYEAIKTAEHLSVNAIASHDYQGALIALSKVRKTLDEFFEGVTINSSDSSLRKNRLALLKRLCEATTIIGDFSALEG